MTPSASWTWRSGTSGTSCSTTISSIRARRAASLSTVLLLRRSGAVRREDLPLRFLSGQVDVQFRTGAALSAKRIAVLAGHDVIPVREVAIGQSRGERVASTGRVHHVFYLNAIDDFPRDPAGA